MINQQKAIDSIKQKHRERIDELRHEYNATISKRDDMLCESNELIHGFQEMFAECLVGMREANVSCRQADRLTSLLHEQCRLIQDI